MHIEIDAVFSGGGVRGFAYIGAIQELERAQITFKRVAGTSAGAIVAAFIAAGISSEEMKEYLQELDSTLLRDEQRFTQKLPLIKWVRLYKKLGLYRGDLLEKWLRDKLARKGLCTFGDLEEGTLKIIASDLSNGEIVVLPDDLFKYGIDANSFSIAKAIRMSCSLPFFYEPMCLDCNGQKALIVDGGVLSNFPLWLFQNEFAERPVIGFQLTGDNKKIPNGEINNGVQLVEALFKTMKDAHDRRYIDKQWARQVVFLPVNDLVGTMEENISEETIEALIEVGCVRTRYFLAKWARIW